MRRLELPTPWSVAKCSIQLSYMHLKMCLRGFEPPTHSLEGCCSIQLSYRHIQIIIPKYLKISSKKIFNNLYNFSLYYIFLLLFTLSITACINAALTPYSSSAFTPAIVVPLGLVTISLSFP